MTISLSYIINQPNLFLILKGFFIIIISIIINIFISFSINKMMNKNGKKRTTEESRSRQTRLNFTKIFLTTIIYGIATISILRLIPGFEVFATSLLAGAGIVAIIVGFAAQKTLSNIVAGISIALFTPFRIGDKLKIGEEIGDVEEMTLRHIVIKTWDNKRIIIPNAIIAEKEIINYSIKEERLMWTVNLGISYDSSIDKAKKIMVNAATNHPNVISPEIKNNDGNIEKQNPKVRVTECGDFAVNLKLFFWVAKPSDAWITGYDLIEKIKKEFDKQGIEIPFPYRTIVYKKDLDKDKKNKK